MTVARAQVGSNGNREAEIVKRLNDFWEQIPRDDCETSLILGLEPEARELGGRTRLPSFWLPASIGGRKRRLFGRSPTCCDRHWGI